MTRLAAAVIALIAGTHAMALTPDQDKALALIGPMLQEVAPGAGGQVLATCVVGAATPEELAQLVAATGPSAEVGAIINAVIARPETIACLQAAAGQ
jgi:uncharacterized membrane protein YeaQ/YmgE (transglycosylase-associated protein family)